RTKCCPARHERAFARRAGAAGTAACAGTREPGPPAAVERREAPGPYVTGAWERLASVPACRACVSIRWHVTVRRFRTGRLPALSPPSDRPRDELSRRRPVRHQRPENPANRAAKRWLKAAQRRAV